MATLRLTRRGRLVLIISVMTMAVLAGIGFGRDTSQAAGRRLPAQHTVVVAAGETLWSVAARIAPHDDPRLVVADIESLNRLPDGDVEAGQRLVVPTIG